MTNKKQEVDEIAEGKFIVSQLLKYMADKRSDLRHDLINLIGRHYCLSCGSEHPCYCSACYDE